MTATTTQPPLTTGDYQRIYQLLNRAVTAEQHATTTGDPGTEIGIEDAAEIIVELYGWDTLRHVLTGHSPRNEDQP